MLYGRGASLGLFLQTDFIYSSNIESWQIQEMARLTEPPSSLCKLYHYLLMRDILHIL